MRAGRPSAAPRAAPAVCRRQSHSGTPDGTAPGRRTEPSRSPAHPVAPTHALGRRARERNTTHAKRPPIVLPTKTITTKLYSTRSGQASQYARGGGGGRWPPDTAPATISSTQVTERESTPHYSVRRAHSPRTRASPRNVSGGQSAAAHPAGARHGAHTYTPLEQRATRHGPSASGYLSRAHCEILRRRSGRPGSQADHST